MKIHKKILLTLLCAVFLIGIHNYVSADNENISYKAEYESAISYKLTITGLEPESEKYDLYRAMICQETDVTGKDFVPAFGQHFPINYNEETNFWEGISHTALTVTQGYSGFDKKGQYYVYVAARVSGSATNWEILDGPTAIETPELPPVGNRISIQPSYNYTRYSIQVNALDTMLYNGVQRTIRFYVGEVTDTELLRKLTENTDGAYEELLQYAKEQVPNLQEDSFQDTETGTLDYNIVANYPIENGKYYFLYSILDNENGTYNDVEDIAIYNGVSSSEGVSLADFEYTASEENETPSNTDNNGISGNTNHNNEINRNNDNTTATIKLPNAGVSTVITIILFVTAVCVIVLFLKNRKYKDIK